MIRRQARDPPKAPDQRMVRLEPEAPRASRPRPPHNRRGGSEGSSPRSTTLDAKGLQEPSVDWKGTDAVDSVQGGSPCTRGYA